MRHIPTCIDNDISAYKIFMVSSRTCPHCQRVKDALNQHNINRNLMKIIEIDSDCRRDEIMQHVEHLSGSRTVPKVWINGNLIGGADDILRENSSGNLRQLLLSAGALYS
uniref:Glutaredoxin domain-containing protein n=1 Tax=Parastrongyloides trichosuri TaxID=131310 RepID=A0A0N4Z9S1_PARTI